MGVVIGLYLTICAIFFIGVMCAYADMKKKSKFADKYSKALKEERLDAVNKYMNEDNFDLRGI